MAPRLHRAAPAKGRRPPGRPSRPPAGSAKPFLRFFHSQELRDKTLRVLGELEQAEDATAHREALADIVVELTNSGMDFYFMRPLRLAKTGFIVEQSASLGMTGVKKVMASVIRQIIGRMEGPQLLSVCRSIRQLML
jgi:hypothetical protein